jgi:hypothetical protein
LESDHLRTAEVFLVVIAQCRRLIEDCLQREFQYQQPRCLGFDILFDLTNVSLRLPNCRQAGPRIAYCSFAIELRFRRNRTRLGFEHSHKNKMQVCESFALSRLALLISHFGAQQILESLVDGSIANSWLDPLSCSPH